MSSPIRVLILEDSEFDSEILLLALKSGGLSVESSRVETLEEFDGILSDKNWDVILSDYNLSEFTALEALRLVQDKQLDIPFLIISGGIGEDVAVAAMKAGAHDYLMKGHLARLVPAIDREIRESKIRSARRKAEVALRESERKYRLLWETAPDAVILVNQAGIIQFANPAAQKVFGYNPAELINQPLELLLPERIRLNYHKKIHQVLQSGVQALPWRSTETLGRQKDGSEIAIEVGIGEMEWREEHLYIGFIRDITKRKKTEETLKEKQDELLFAREIQQRLFPKANPDVQGYDISGISISAAEAGGDYFDYLPMIKQRLGLVVGDVVGHGIGAALLMAEIRAYLRLLARNREDPGLILTRANQVLAQDTGGHQFITLFLACLDPLTKTIFYGSAGHPPSYILNSRGQIKAKLKRTGIPLGMNPRSHYTTGETHTLESGDLLLILTDGFEESLSPEDDIYGIERVLETVQAHQHLPSREIVGQLYNAVRKFSCGQAQLDDLTAVVMKVL